MSHKVQQHVVLADPDIIEQLGCVVDNVPYAFVPVSESTALPTTTALHHPSGWSFYSFHRSILSEHEVVRTAQRIKVDLLQQYHSLSSMEDQASWLAGDQIDVNGFKLHLPPMFFAGDLMLLKSPKDKKMISVSPMDAMQTWAAKVSSKPVK